MANEPKSGVVQTPLGPLPEDFFELEPKAKLRAQLAQAHKIWRGAKDDQDGQKLRWYAYQLALGAVLEYVKDDVPSEHSYLLVRLAEYLDDLKRGRQPEEMRPALRPKHGPGLETAPRDDACDCLCDSRRLVPGPRPGLLGKKYRGRSSGSDRRAARRVQSWRKASNAGRKGPQAREAYDGILRM